MTTWLTRALVALTIGGTLLGVPTSASPNDVTNPLHLPFETMWGFSDCPNEVAPPVEWTKRNEKAEADATQDHEPLLLAFDAFPDLCRRTPAAVICAGHTTGKKLTVEEAWQVDFYLRYQFKYRSDWATAGFEDHWRNWTVCGDCEDYALTLSELLAARGQDGAEMKLQLMWVKKEDGSWAGHATLLIDTADAGWVEASVGTLGNPHPLYVYPADTIKRGATIPLDGSRKATPAPGYVIMDGDAVMEDFRLDRKP